VIVIDPVIGALHESGSRLWLGPPKTAASVRTITLPPFLITLLGEHLETSDENAVFAGPRGGWLRRSNVYRRALRPAADGNLHIANPRVRALPIRPGLTFHGLRHSHKTWLIDDGMPEIAHYITYGASPRASINLILTARALAFVRGRNYALPQDVIDMARDVIRHRLVLSFEALSDNVTSDAILSTVLGRVPVPVVPLREPTNGRVSA